MKLKMLFVGLAITTLCAANAERPVTVSDITKYIRAAVNEIVVAAPALRVKSIAQELLNALYYRQVRVRLLTDQRFVFEPASYWWHLEQYGAELRVLSSVNGYDMIIDGTTLIRGAKFAIIAPPFADSTTLVSTGETRVRGTYKTFDHAWKFAAPITTEKIVGDLKEKK